MTIDSILLPGLSFSGYLEEPGLSSSMLRKLRQSPYACKRGMEEPEEDNAAFLVGRALHCLVLEGISTFEARYGCKGKSRKKIPDGLQDGRELLTDAQMTQVMRMGLAIASEGDLCKSVRDLLESVRGNVEISLFWEDAWAKPCKARLDAWSPSASVVLDLKTTTAIDQRSIERAIFEYGYHIQAAWYLEGMAAVGVEPAPDAFWLLFLQKYPPYEIGLYELDAAALELGRREVASLHKRYRECEHEDRWPMRQTTIETIGVPEWALKNGGNQ